MAAIKQREQVFCDYCDFLAHDDDWLISRLKFPRAILLEFCTELGLGLERETGRSHALPVQYDPDYAWFSGNRIIAEGMTGH